MLLFWTIFSALSFICSTNAFDYNVKAVVLFYKDSQGRFLLSAGPIPDSTEKVIRQDVLELLDQELPVEVISIYKNLSDIPYDTDIMKSITSSYAVIHIASLSNDMSKKIIQDMRKHTYSDTIEIDYSYRRVRRPERQGNETADDNIDEPVKGYKGKKLSPEEVQKKKGFLPSPEDYVPNDIYYGIEISCVNWDPMCTMTPEFTALASHLKPEHGNQDNIPLLA